MTDKEREDKIRTQALDAAGTPGERPKTIDLTPAEARTLIDNVFESYGLDSGRATDPYGWRHLSLGSARGVAGVIEWEPELHYLVVCSPILRLPADSEVPAGLYKQLLELNHDGTLAARFSIQDNIVYVGLTRPIRGLDEEEVHDAIRSVMAVADSYDDWLHTNLDIALGLAPLPLSKLPSIKMTPQEAQMVGSVLASCDPHGREIFGYLMEGWERAGHVVVPSASGISLSVGLGTQSACLASMRPGVGKRRQLLILTWEGLRRQGGFSPEAVDAFQAEVLEISPVKVIDALAHVEVTEAFDREHADTLLRAMQGLVRTVVIET